MIGIKKLYFETKTEEYVALIVSNIWSLNWAPKKSGGVALFQIPL